MSTAQPGPLAEEAARLVEAITEWARGAVGDVSMPSVNSGPECQVCPICQLLALVRRTQPETFGHLTDASASMVAALRTVIDRHDHSGRRHSGVERIDLDDRDPAADAYSDGSSNEGFDDADNNIDEPVPQPPLRSNPAPSRSNEAPSRDALADALGVGRNGRRGASRTAAAAKPTTRTTTRRRSASQKPAE
jgi:hypothetical protein